ncbi:MAG: HAMP domain-containing histidine kinase [Kordiimonadaceae bacterium]|nr:HAMP domain-containing histidine kinase [Kordiimonadaceae bacterium]
MPEHYRPVTSSLRARLLILTFMFVMLVAFVVYFPSIAFFRKDFLEKRLENAEIASLSLEAAENYSVSPELEQRLLNTAGVISVVVRRQERSYLLGGDVRPEEVDAKYDLRQTSLGELITDALMTLDARGTRAISVVGNSMIPGTRWFEVTLDEAELYEELSAHANQIMLLSVIISIFIGILVYLSLHLLVVRPMRKVKDSIVAFRRRPEAAVGQVNSKRRSDEIGLISRELARMQDEVRQSLNQKNRLASLGEAVAKISHDLRNVLATAQLAADALQRVDDPRVQKVSSRLMRAVTRAIALCEGTLKHGKADDPVPEKESVHLAKLLEDVGSSLGLIEADAFNFDIQIDEEFRLYADSEQLYRVFLNLCRNAHQVQGDEGTIAFSAKCDEDGTCHVYIADNGPGISEAVQPNLFKAFASATTGGTGLGLATSRDILLAHGGTIELEKTSADGSVFKLCLPAESK